MVSGNTAEGSPAQDVAAPILVVGAGIGGLAAALALGRQGRRVQVLEQASEIKEVGAGLQLGPNVFKMFETLGDDVVDAVNDVAVFPDALVMRNALSGEALLRMPLDDAFRHRFHYPYGVIYRPDLHRILIAACQASPAITISVNQQIDRFEDSGEQVRLITTAGDTHQGVAVIGADGLWSNLRRQIVGDGDPRVSGHIAYRAVLPVAEVEPRLRPNEVVLWAGPRTHLVQYPLHRGDVLNLVAVFHSSRYEEGWDAYGDPEELAQAFAGQHPDVLALLAKIESWRMWVLCDREPVKHWSKGRASLLGDAAHPMLQYLAQGACMAIEDAVCLASKVESHGSDYATAFRAYQQDRYLRTGRVQITARLYGDVYHAAGVSAELRDRMIAARTTEQAYEGLAWLYQGIDASGAQKDP